MSELNHITIRSDKRDIVLNIGTVLYVLMKKNYAQIHTSSGKCYKTIIRSLITPKLTLITIREKQQ